MTTFTCNNDYNSIMTTIYDAWASKLGHENVKLELIDNYLPNLFSKHIHIDPDKNKANLVTKTIKEKLGHACYSLVFYTICSEKPEKVDLIYRFLIKAFKIGPGIINMLQDPVVMEMFEYRRRVSNEAHLFREFLRFSSVNNSVYIAHFEPKADVLTFVAEHFADRMPSEYWIIVDDTRDTAAVHPINEDFYLVELSETEKAELSLLDNTQDQFTALWQTYFKSIAIKERENSACQLNHFPQWMRKHATEFN